MLSKTNFSGEILEINSFIINTNDSLLLLVKSGFVTPEGLASKRRYAILVSFIAAAILTPPDVISQVMLATPIILLYEISIIASKLMYKNNN